MKIGNYFSYPYVCFKGIYIPLSVFAIYFICIGILLYSINHHFRHKNYQTIHWNGGFLWYFLSNILILGMLLAYAETDSEHVIHKIMVDTLQTFRQIDIFLFVAFIMLFLMGIKYKNRYTYINTLIKYFVFANYAEAAAIVLLRYKKEEKGFAPWTFFVAWGISIAIINAVLKNFKLCKSKRSLFFLQQSNNLFDTRKGQLEEIYDKIKTYTKEEQMTIFISDEWGGGKTFFASCLYRKIKGTKNKNIVWLNLADFNEQETFIRQVFRKIQMELNSNNYYTGETSEFEKYFAAVLNVALNESVADLILEQIRARNKNVIKSYVSLTEVSKEFSQMLGDSHIVIIIDDIDRCTDETIKEALKLFSEIIMLPKSIIVFVGDYKQLMNKQGFKEGFFDKYFMHNYNLATVQYSTLFEYYETRYNFSKMNLSFEINLLDRIQLLFTEITEWYTNEYEKGIAENRDLKEGHMRDMALEQATNLINNMKDGVSELRKKLSNPRRVSRIYNEVYEKLKKIEKAINKDISNDEHVNKIIEELVFPAIFFHSLAANICTNKFHDIKEKDFEGFKDETLNIIAEMSTREENIEGEMKIYRLLVYYFFSTRFQTDEMRMDKFKNYYLASNLKNFLSTNGHITTK